MKIPFNHDELQHYERILFFHKTKQAMDILCDTVLYVVKVKKELKQIQTELIERGLLHDSTKFQKYTNNCHHTTSHKKGINEINLIDLLRIIADGRAIEQHSPNKALIDTLDYTFNKYGVKDQLRKIIKNTLRDFNWI